MLNRMIPFSLMLCAILGCSNSRGPSNPGIPVTPQRSPAPADPPDTATSNPTQRLARAAEVREYLKDNNIPANVIEGLRRAGFADGWL